MALITTDLFYQFDANNGANLSVISDEVDTWTDEISGYVLSAPDATSRPAYSASVQINGINAVYFNGVDTQTLELSEFGTGGSETISPSTYPHLYRFSVIKIPHYTSLVANRRVFDNGDLLTGGRQALQIDNNGVMQIVSPGADSDTFSYPDDTAFILCEKLNESSSGLTLQDTLVRINKETIIDNSVGNMVNTDGLTIGSRSGLNDPLPEIAVAEVLFYRKTTPLNLSDIEEIEDYLNDKWAVFSENISGTITDNAGNTLSGVDVDMYELADAESTALTFKERVQTNGSGIYTSTFTIDKTKGILGLSTQRTVVASGTATSGAVDSLTDSGASRAVDGDANLFIRITGGTGSGQERVVASNTATSWTPSLNFATAPDATSTYEIVEEKRGVNDYFPPTSV